ncbi:hypothetical protein FRUB_03956 [Fimbriiglobus ruber]|uniref:Putative restriction endonuclease domain-containing protein n=2 Tax=Fimbriiglobus ruber TaxID=1908690 RepID=A0A225DTL4_9BACT|nr:hypothetical protein FRUB_03956 [Fimbriiglobus ruber]
MTPPLTADEFFEWANRPENAGRRFELESGEVIEMPPPGLFHGVVCWLVGVVLSQYLFRRGRGFLSTNDAGLIVQRGPDTVRGPDLMLFLESQELDQITRKHTDQVPALVVEVFSPTDKPGRLNRRVAQYHGRGVPLVWVVFPEERTVNVYRPNEPPAVLDEAEELTGDGVLPDFRCRVSDLFRLPGKSSQVDGDVSPPVA